MHVRLQSLYDKLIHTYPCHSYTMSACHLLAQARPHDVVHPSSNETNNYNYQEYATLWLLYSGGHAARQAL